MTGAAGWPSDDGSAQDRVIRGGAAVHRRNGLEPLSRPTRVALLRACRVVPLTEDQRDPTRETDRALSVRATDRGVAVAATLSAWAPAGGSAAAWALGGWVRICAERLSPEPAACSRAVSSTRRRGPAGTEAENNGWGGVREGRPHVESPPRHFRRGGAVGAWCAVGYSYARSS